MNYHGYSVVTGKNNVGKTMQVDSRLGTPFYWETLVVFIKMAICTTMARHTLLPAVIAARFGLKTCRHIVIRP